MFENTHLCCNCQNSFADCDASEIVFGIDKTQMQWVLKQIWF